MYNSRLPSFESLPYQSAVLDPHGIIIAVNAAWRVFAGANGASAQLRDGVGLNYLSICRGARGEFSDAAHLATVCIEEALARRRPRATFQYRCHSPSGDRWFLCVISTADVDVSNQGVMISHVELSELNQSAHHPLSAGNEEGPHWRDHHAMVALETRFLEESPLHQHLQEGTATGCWELDPFLKTLRLTEQSYRILETSPALFNATFESMIKLFGPKSRVLLQSLLMQLAQHGAPFDIQLSLLTFGKKRIWILMTGRAEIRGVKIRRIYGLMQDITACRDSQKQVARAERSRRTSK